MSKKQALQAELAKCRDDLARFNRTILGRPAYWHRQREICRSVERFPVTLVPAGNAVGKSYADAGILLAYLLTRPGSLVLATAPSQTQLEEVLWKSVESAYHGSRIPIGGRLLKDPLKVELGNGWEALAYSTTKVERLSGHHRADLLAIVDEGSGVAPEIFEALDSCNPSRYLITGNPLRPDGPFYERCQRAEAKQGDPERLANLIRISSLESPDIELARSPRGMADRTWLEKARNDYGEGSIWWLSHVLALFPDSASDSLLSRAWLDAAGLTVHLRTSAKRIMSIDLAEGNGDPAGILVRDPNGVIEATIGQWGLEETAKRAAAAAERHHVAGDHVIYDATGIGADFRNRLDAVGLKGSRGYKGGTSGGEHFDILRSAAAWALRQRLDPGRLVRQGPIEVKQLPFAIPSPILDRARRELQALRFRLLGEKKIGLEPKEDMKKALGNSPTYADLLIMSFAYPNL